MRTVCLQALILVVAFGQVSAQEPLRPVIDPDGIGVINDVNESKVALHAATPYLESSSAVMIDVDLTKVNVEAGVQWAQTQLNLGQLPAAATTVVNMVGGFIQTMRGAGVEHVYICAAPRSLIDQGPVVVIPCDNTDIVNGLVALIVQNAPSSAQLKTHIGPNVVVVGPATALDRVVEGEGAERPDLILAAEQHDRLDHVLVISLPADAREELIAFWPDRLSESSPIAISPKNLVKDVNRIVLSWRLPPEPDVGLRVQCTDDAAALRVSEILAAAVGMNDQVKELVQVQLDRADVKIQANPRAVISLAAKFARQANQQSQHMSKMNDLKQLGLAMHNYHAVHKHLPAVAIVDQQGKPLLSWRVPLLIYLDQQALYQAIQLDQAFDSDANRVTCGMRVPVFGNVPGQPTKTTYRLPRFPGSLWDGDGAPKRFQNVIDGTANTIAILDAPVADAVAWADPQPWIIDEQDPMSDVFGDRDEVTALMMDGSVRVLTRQEMNNDKLKALLTIAGGESP